MNQILLPGMKVVEDVKKTLFFLIKIDDSEPETKQKKMFDLYGFI